MPEPEITDMKRNSSYCCFNCVEWTCCAYVSAPRNYVSPNNQGRCEEMDGYSWGWETCKKHERRKDMPEGGRE